jgi:hypothetical protein
VGVLVAVLKSRGFSRKRQGRFKFVYLSRILEKEFNLKELKIGSSKIFLDTIESETSRVENVATISLLEKYGLF